MPTPRRQKLPIIEFRVSRIYNIQWQRPKELQDPPPKVEWFRRRKTLEAMWKKHGRNILQTMSAVTGLPWEEDRIIVYLTWGIISFSDPLTLNLRKDVVMDFETLTHELIHRISSSPKNQKKIERRWKAFTKKYPKEVPVGINHVPIHAVHEVMWEKLFPKRVAALAVDIKKAPYIRSWQIVHDLGAAEVVRRVYAPRLPKNRNSRRVTA